MTNEEMLAQMRSPAGFHSFGASKSSGCFASATHGLRLDRMADSERPCRAHGRQAVGGSVEMNIDQRIDANIDLFPEVNRR